MGAFDEARSVYVRRGSTISIEHGYLCIRDRDGWLMYDCKVSEMPSKGLNLSEILCSAYDNRKPSNPLPAPSPVEPPNDSADPQAPKAT